MIALLIAFAAIMVTIGLIVLAFVVLVGWAVNGLGAEIERDRMAECDGLGLDYCRPHPRADNRQDQPEWQRSIDIGGGAFINHREGK